MRRANEAVSSQPSNDYIFAATSPLYICVLDRVVIVITVKWTRTNVHLFSRFARQSIPNLQNSHEFHKHISAIYARVASPIAYAISVCRTAHRFDLPRYASHQRKQTNDRQQKCSAENAWQFVRSFACIVWSGLNCTSSAPFLHRPYFVVYLLLVVLRRKHFNVLKHIKT